MWPLKSIALQKKALFWGFQHTFFCISKDVDGKMFIFQVNAGIYLRSNKYFCKVKYML